MGAQTLRKLNRLEQELPEGLIVDAAWLEARGYYGSLRKKYIDQGWLRQPAHRVYRRGHGPLTWEQVVVSLQTLLAVPMIVGGRTALDLQGFTHYLSHERSEIHLYGDWAPPRWLHELPVRQRFCFHRSTRIFRDDPGMRELGSVRWNLRTGEPAGDTAPGTSGAWDWPAAMSTPERALLELLEELPRRESFQQVDRLVEGMANLSPRRLQKLLEACKSVKVKRLFFFFADRHRHAWLNRIERHRVDLGAGKRMIVRGGTYDAAHQITVPKDLDALR